MCDLLKPLRESLPPGSFPVTRFFYKKKFILQQEYYDHFSHFLAESLMDGDENHYLLADWTETPYHSLIFNIDIKNADPNTTHVLLRYFYGKFLDVLEKHIPLPTLTIILAMQRSQSGGLHIHIPGVAIAHDDYIHLCSLMMSSCYFQKHNIQLDCPSRMCLVGSGNGSKKDIYVPVSMLRVQFPKNRDMKWRIVDKVNVTGYHPIKEDCFDQCKMQMYLEMASLMMPFSHKTWKVLYYPTKIVPETKQNAHFKSFINRNFYRFDKSNALQVEDRQSEGSFCYRFLQQHSIKFLGRTHQAIETWHKSSFCNFEGPFRGINIRLRNECAHLKHEENPLKTMLMNSEYVLPIFYALCHELRKKQSSQDILNALIQLHYPVKALLKDGPPLRLTFNTLRYCAFHTCPSKTKEGIFWKFIGIGWDWIFETMTTVEQMQASVKCVQEIHFPIVRSEEHLYAWNHLLMKWVRIREEEVEAKIRNVYYEMGFFPGFSKLSESLRLQLRNEKEWIQKIAEDQLEKLRKGPFVKENIAPDTWKDMGKYYGINVPEYFFFNWNVPAEDTTCEII